MKIQRSDTTPSRDAICRWLREFNDDSNGAYMRSLDEGARQDFMLVANDNENLVGGIIGILDHQWIRIDLMAVAPRQRRKGIGKQLIAATERLGLDHGCRSVYVDTMSYQSPDFYLACGFNEVGRLTNWDSHGHDKLFLTKSLTVKG